MNGDGMGDDATDSGGTDDGMMGSDLFGGQNMNTAGAGNDSIEAGSAGASAVGDAVDTDNAIANGGCPEGMDQECTDYCEEYLSLCTNQFNDYTGMEDCMTYCSCFPRADGFGAAAFQGNTLECRIGHFGNIEDGGNVHCWHAGIEDDLCSD